MLSRVILGYNKHSFFPTLAGSNEIIKASSYFVIKCIISVLFLSLCLGGFSFCIFLFCLRQMFCICSKNNHLGKYIKDGTSELTVHGTYSFPSVFVSRVPQGESPKSINSFSQIGRKNFFLCFSSLSPPVAVLCV